MQTYRGERMSSAFGRIAFIFWQIFDFFLFVLPHSRIPLPTQRLLHLMILIFMIIHAYEYCNSLIDINLDEPIGVKRPNYARTKS